MLSNFLTQINWTLFSIPAGHKTPLRGISTFTKLFSARKAQKIISKVLKIAAIIVLASACAKQKPAPPFKAAAQKKPYTATRADAERSMPERVVIQAPPDCKLCHDDIGGQVSYKYYPLRFSHKTHFDLGVECIFCHRDAPNSTSIDDNLLPEGHNLEKITSEEFPDPNPCKACHLYLSEFGKKDKTIPAMCDTCHSSYKGKASVPFEEVSLFTRLKNNHKVHFDKGLPCLRCHVDFDKLEEPVSQFIPTRDLCTECHEKVVNAVNEESLSPRSGKFSAEELFMTNCSVCHGPEGRGDGTVAGFFKAGLRPRDLTGPVYMGKRTDEQLFNVIYYGGPELMLSERMPAWEGLLSEEEVNLLVKYVRDLSLTP